MKISLLLMMTLISHLISCADPNYIDKPVNNLNITNVSDCEYLYSSENLCMQANWETLPTSTSFGSMSITFYKIDELSQDKIPTSPKNEFEIELWMPSMEHGSSPVSLQKIAEGKFQTRDIFFIMPGDWDINYHLKNGTQIIETKTQQIYF